MELSELESLRFKGEMGKLKKTKTKPKHNFYERPTLPGLSLTMGPASGRRRGDKIPLGFASTSGDLVLLVLKTNVS
jgi:hypothetical protein